VANNWDGKTENNIPIYSADAYTYGVALIPIALIIAFIGFVFIKQSDETILLKDND
jgi:hypothetical protein